VKYKIIILLFFVCGAKLCIAQLTTIHFSLHFNREIFQLEKDYTTTAGELIQVYKMKFYISGLKGVTAKGDTILLSKEHFLIDAADSNTQKISLQIPSIQSLIFTIGVDSLRNTNGIQSGTLDPAKGMFWTWNSGYIMAKMEGISSAANTAGNRFTHDIGGFKQPFNSTRMVQLPLKQNKINNSTVYIEVNLSNWFNGKHKILLKEQAICHTPGLLAMQLADNFATSFSIKE
jgi:hypothetical protein